MVMGSSFFSNQEFSASGVVKGVCVCGVATPHTQTPLTTPEAENSWLEKKDDPMTMELTVGIQFQA